MRPAIIQIFFRRILEPDNSGKRRMKKSQQRYQPLPAFFDNKILRRCFDPYLNHSVEPRDIQ